MDVDNMERGYDSCEPRCLVPGTGLVPWIAIPNLQRGHRHKPQTIPLEYRRTQATAIFFMHGEPKMLQRLTVINPTERAKGNEDSNVTQGLTDRVLFQISIESQNLVL